MDLKMFLFSKTLITKRAKRQQSLDSFLCTQVQVFLTTVWLVQCIPNVCYFLLHFDPFESKTRSRVSRVLKYTPHKLCPTFWGVEWQTVPSYNAHVIHLAEDVKKTRYAENLQCFKYETFLHQLKKLVRKSQSPLSQTVRRLSEIPQRRREEIKTVHLRKEHLSGPLPEHFARREISQFKRVKMKRFILRLDQANSYVSTSDSIVKAWNIISSGRGI